MRTHPSDRRTGILDRLRWASGPLLTAALVLVIELLWLRGIRTPNVSVLLVGAILFATFLGGTAAGLVSAAIAIAFYAFYASLPGRLFYDETQDLERVVSTLLVSGLTVLILGLLHGRVRRLLERERTLRAEAEAARHRVVTILESIGDGFFVVDSAWRYVYVNAKAEELVKRTREQLLGNVVWDEFPPLVDSAWDTEYHRAMETGERVHFEAYYPPLEAWFETRAYPSEAGLTIYLTDITARKRAQLALDARLQQQAAVASLGMRSIQGGDLSAVLDEAVRLVAATLEVDAVKVLELQPDGASLLLRAGIGWKEGTVGRATVPSGADSQAGYTLRCGEPVIVHDLREETRFHGPRLLLDRGLISGISVAIRCRAFSYGVLGAHTLAPRHFTTDDVNFLQAIANVIAQTIEQRRAAEELRASEGARVAAEAAIAARDEVLAVVSHDLRNPLGSILVAAALLERPLPDERRGKQIATIKRSADRMRRLIEDLLDFARIDAGKLSLRSEPCDMAQMLQELRDALQGQADERSVRLDVSVDVSTGVVSTGTRPTALCDRARVLQALTNLVENALKFTPAGGSIVMSTEPQGTEVWASVSDTGPGIERDRIPRLFDRFWQAERGDRRGAGLGLSIVKGIIEAHGGRVWVDSEPGRGSTFWLALPAAERV